ncbi:hypothetical protein ACQPWY_08575 [Pseudonocardia xinjiangensis]|uniref:hypothetical protein n=1 Tax=Pseudonocardia xinjiangensis TaxID=75289 RepID=UPI003D91CF00
MLAPRPTHGTAVPTPPVLPGAVGGVLGLPAGAVAVMVTWVYGGSPTTGLVLATAAAVTLGAMATTPGAIVAAVLSWACYDGFVVHSLGTIEAGRADLVALAVVVVAALAAHLVGVVTRHRDQRTSQQHARATRRRRHYAADELPDVQRRTRSTAR